MTLNPAKYFEASQKLDFGHVGISKEEIIDFATQFDPIYFHLDEEAAKSSMLGGLAASGFHTCALTHRMVSDAYLSRFELLQPPKYGDCKWLLPVRPADTLGGCSTIVDTLPSEDWPGAVIVQIRHEVSNQKQEKVALLDAEYILGTKKGSAASE